jgi:hypothetical protein
VKNYYEDLGCRLDKEVDLLVRSFRRHGKLLSATLSRGGPSYNGLISHVENAVIPWVRQQVQIQVDTLRRDALVAVKEIEIRLDQVSRMSRRRMQDKAEKWMHIAWNSLRATARKHGVHTTCRGVHIDSNQDICSVLVDDLILAWSSYRDDLIRERVVAATSEMTSGLVDRLKGAIARHSDIRLTLGIYTHAELADQTDAITSLPAPPGPKSQAPAAEATKDESPPSEAEQPRDFSPAPAQSEVPTVVPRGADMGAIQFAAETIQIAPFCTLDGGVTGDSVVSYALDSRENCNRAEGIRTPDQGIMSPLL